MQEKYQLKVDEYYVELDGSISSFNPVLKMSEFGINFETIEEARKAEKAFNDYHMLYKLAKELNPIGWEPKWSEFHKEVACTIEFNHEKDCLCVLAVDSPYDTFGAIYFASEEIAEKAIEILRSTWTRI